MGHAQLVWAMPSWPKETSRFRDRADAGRRLAAALASDSLANPIVLALPRGGVSVGYEVARALHAALDVWVVRKIAAPDNPELGLGAVAEGGYVHLARDLVDVVGLDDDDLRDLITARRHEVEANVRKFRGNRPPPPIRARTVIVVDDGIATGVTVCAVLRSIRAQQPDQLVLAVPVAAAETIRKLEAEVDRVVCLLAPTHLFAVGLWYEDFDQVSDDEVLRLLEAARREPSDTEQVA
jgi:putative phosphoribosyl transferase